MRQQVQPSPTPRDFPTLLPVLREDSFAINELIDGLDQAEVRLDIIEDRFPLPVVLTADLPAADAVPDGTVLVEQSGGFTRNLIVYSAGLRTRFVGVNF